MASRNRRKQKGDLMSVESDCKKSQKMILEMCNEIDRLKTVKSTMAIKRGLVTRKGTPPDDSARPASEKENDEARF